MLLTDTSIEAAIRARLLPPCIRAEADADWVAPDYDGGSVANVPASIYRTLTADALPLAGPLRDDYVAGLATGVSRVVLVLVDALGYRYFQDRLLARPSSAFGRLARRGVHLPMTSVFPSTTAAALGSVLTGVAPVSHGLLGYELWLREFGVLAEMLAFRPAYGKGSETLIDWGMQPEAFIPVRTLAERLAEKGVSTVAVAPAVFAQSGLTRCVYRGFERIVGYRDIIDMWIQASRYVPDDSDRCALVFVYWGGLDTAIHLHGTRDGVWQAQYELVSRTFEEQFLMRLRPEQRRGTLLVLCADHGFVDAPPDSAHDTDSDALFRELLVVPFSGEARAAFLHVRRQAPADAASVLARALASRFVVVPSRDAAAQGLFGPGAPAPESHARLGDLLVLGRGNAYLDRREGRLKLRGRHGGLSVDEMLVPCLVARLDD